MSRAQPSRLIIVLFILTIVVFLSTVLYSAAIKQHPGHADPSFYVTLAKNLAAGKGFYIDYVWHYVYKPATVSHYAIDTWLPGASLIQSIFILLFGDDLFYITLSSVTFVLFTAIAVMWCSYRLSGSLETAMIAVIFLLAIPNTFRFALSNETQSFYTFFVFISLALAFLGFKRKAFFILSGPFVAFANMIRGDGVLLLGVLLISSFVFFGGRNGARVWVYTFAVYLLFMLPLYLLNYWSVGYLMPPSYKVAFLKEYKELFMFHTENLNLSHYLTLDTLDIIKQKMRAFTTNSGRILGWPVSFLVAIYIMSMAVNKDAAFFRRQIPFVLFFVTIFVFYVLVLDKYYQGFRKSIGAISVPLAIIAAHFIGKDVGKYMRIVIVGIYVVTSLPQSVRSALEVTARNARTGERYRAMCEFIDIHNLNVEQSAVVMTRQVWELHESCGVKAVQVPSDGPDAFIDVYRLYKPNFLLVEREWLARRPYLKRVYNRNLGRIGNVGFQLVGNPLPGVKFYKLKEDVPNERR